MGRLCERPGCSEPGAASYGMVPEDLLFWVDTFHRADGHDSGVLCRRHADAMVVPRGWTLDDRREPHPRLFRSPADASGSIARPKRRRSPGSVSMLRERVEQLELEAAEIEASRPVAAFGAHGEPGADPGIDSDVSPGAGDDTDSDTDTDTDTETADVGPAPPWAPIFDSNDDLDGLLHVDSPLLARAFRGTDRAR